MTEEKRQSERENRMVVVEFREVGSSDEYYAGITRDYSEDGFSFESEAPDLLSGTVLEFILKHPDKEKSLEFVGDVAWTSKQTYGVIAGVKLHSLSIQNQKMLNEIISSSVVLPKDTAENTVDELTVTSGEMQEVVYEEKSSDAIAESIVAAVNKKRSEGESGEERRYVPDAVIPSAVADKVVRQPDKKDKSGIFSKLIIVTAIVAMCVVSFYYLFNENKFNFLPDTSSSLKNDEPSQYDSVDNWPIENNQLEENQEIVAETISAPVQDVAAITADDKEFNTTLSAQAGEEMDEAPLAVILEEEKEDVKEDASEEEINTGLATEQEIPVLNMPDIASAEKQDKGPEVQKSVAPKRYIIHVAAWRTIEYAKSIKEKLSVSYPNATMVFENDFHIIMIPDIKSREDASVIVEDLTGRFDVTPLIYLQTRKTPNKK